MSTADGGSNREGCSAWVGKSPYQHFPFYFQAHDEKEQRHQAVVDPVGKGMRERCVAYGQTEFFMPEMSIALGADIRPEKCRDGSEQ